MTTFVFFVGGTGARVLRSMVMLMASGVEVKDNGRIVPVIIDYDIENGDLKQAKDLLDSYNTLCQGASYQDSEKGFFKQKVETERFSYAAIQFDASKNTFGRFLAYDSMDNSTKKLMESLYDNSPSDVPTTELNLDLSVGFKGNPNIGSVVFNDYFSDMKWGFRDFMNSVKEGDRIFVVGSIFGGTGSSGIPQLIKRLEQTGSETKSNMTAVINAMKGACIVLPYFGVKQDDGSAVDSRTFNSKAKAALSYYETAINDSLDEVYYIGSREQRAYENCEGGAAQKNNAHLVELLAAMSIFEFADRKFDHAHKDGHVAAYEFGTKYGFNESNHTLNTTTYLDFLGFDINNPVDCKYVSNLNEFAYFVKYALLNIYTDKPDDDSRGLFHGAQAYYKSLGANISKDTDFGRRLSDFCRRFVAWSNEMATNAQLKFKPYNFDTANLDEVLCVNSNMPKAKGVDNAMKMALNNTNEEYKGKSLKAEQVFMRCAYNAGLAAVEKKLN